MESPHLPRDEKLCYVTTRGRRTGRPHTIEIWFAARGSTLYILAGGGERSDTVRNVRADARATVRVGDRTWVARARVVGRGREAAWARRAVADKYAGDEDGLVEWSLTALPVAFDLELPADR